MPKFAYLEQCPVAEDLIWCSEAVSIGSDRLSPARIVLMANNPRPNSCSWRAAVLTELHSQKVISPHLPTFGSRESRVVRIDEQSRRARDLPVDVPIRARLRRHGAKRLAELGFHGDDARVPGSRYIADQCIEGGFIIEMTGFVFRGDFKFDVGDEK